MPYDIDTEPIVIKVPAQVAVPEGAVSGPEWLDALDKIADLEARALADLVSGTPADGDALVYDAATQTWKPGSVTGSIARVQNGPNSKGVDDVKAIIADNGLDVKLPDPPTGKWIYIRPLYGTAANTVAQGNHTHQIRPGVPFPFPASGSLSSGTRTLVSGNVTGLDPARTYIVWGTLKVQLRGEGAGAGYSTPRITINANGVNDVEPVRTVSGVPHTAFMEHEGVTVSGVSSVAVSATLAYSSGDPIHVGAGKLVIRVKSNR